MEEFADDPVQMGSTYNRLQVIRIYNATPERPDELCSVLATRDRLGLRSRLQVDLFVPYRYCLPEAAAFRKESNRNSFRTETRTAVFSQRPVRRSFSSNTRLSERVCRSRLSPPPPLLYIQARSSDTPHTPSITGPACSNNT